MTLSSSSVSESLALIELKPGTQVRLEVLKDLLPNPQVALFFGKIYKLDYIQLSRLLRKLFDTTVIETLLSEEYKHSLTLQDYLITTVPDAELMQAGLFDDDGEPVEHDEEDLLPEADEPQFLPELWDQLEVEMADSIAQLVESLDGALSMVQGKYGKMLFTTLAKLSRQRQNAIGTYEAQIKHPHVPNNLVIFDVSYSVSRETAEKIVDEVVALAYRANASLAIVSDNTFLWEPGTFSSADVMKVAEFNGTHYETLASIFNRNWATVITIADYDSGFTVRDYLAQRCTGRIQQVLDISLVNRPTYLAECVGQLADKVQPLLVGSSRAVLTN